MKSLCVLCVLCGFNLCRFAHNHSAKRRKNGDCLVSIPMLGEGSLNVSVATLIVL